MLNWVHSLLYGTEDFYNIHNRRVRYFRSLYDEVTKILEHISRNDPKLSNDEQEWLKFLIQGFETRYQNWPEAEQVYLRHLYKQGSATFTLVGHAYLHIAYDLPLVIAESANDSIGNNIKVEIKRSSIYQHLEEGLAMAVSSEWRKPLIARMLLQIPIGFSAIFLNWAVGLRRAAWSFGMELGKLSREGVVSLFLKNHTVSLSLADEPACPISVA